MTIGYLVLNKFVEDIVVTIMSVCLPLVTLIAVDKQYMHCMYIKN